MTTPLLLDILLKGAAVLALATLAVFCLRRTTAAARHLLWTSALVAALIIPLASVTLPAWRVLPQWMDSQAVVTVSQETKQVISPSSTLTETPVSSLVPEALPRIDSPESLPTALESTEPLVVRPDVPSPTPTTIPLAGPTEPTKSDSITAAVSPDTPLAPARSEKPFPWVTIWLAGVLLMLAPLALSALSLHRLERRSKRITTGTLTQVVSRLRHELGLRRRVRLLLGPDDAMPMVWGFRQARLLLPRDAATWSEETLRTVLLHELAHLKRRDPLTLLLSHLSVALHWPNPFAWLALRGVRIECEQAADDAVLRSGVRPSDYATDMLSLSEQCRPLLLNGAAMSMARPSAVTKRISAVLERGRNRRQLAIRVCVLTTLIASLLALPLAMLQAVTIVHEDEDVEKKAELSFEEKTRAYLELQKEPYSKERSERLVKEREEFIKLYDPERILKFADALDLHVAIPFISGAMAKLARQDGSDLAALVGRVNAMKIIAHREASAFSVVRAAAERDPDAAVALIPNLRLRSEVRQATEALVYEDLIVRDPSTAATFIAKRPRTRMTNVALQVVAAYWGARELPACLNWSRSLTNLADRHSTRHAAIQACARRHPKGIVSLLQKTKEEGRSESAWVATPAQLRGAILNTAHRALLDTDRDSAEAWIASLPKDGSVPDNWLKVVTPSALPTIEDAQKLPEGSYRREEIIHQRLGEMARKDPKRALELSLQLPIKRRIDVAHSAAQALIKTDLDAAVAFFDKHPVEFAVTNGNAFVDTYFALAGRDLAGAEKVLALANDPRCRIPAGRLREIALGALVRFDSPERAFKEASKIGGSHVNGVCRQWLRYDRTGFLAWMNLTPENRVLGLVALIHQTAEQAPIKAAEYIKELDPLAHEDSSHHWRWKVTKIFHQLLKRDEKYALKWAETLKSRDFALPAWVGVATHLTRSDPKAAAEWITNLPAGLGRKAAAHGFFYAQINERISGHNFSIGSTAFQPDTFDKNKEKEAAGILAKMKPEHHEAARLVLEALDLDEDTHQRLLKSFAK